MHDQIYTTNPMMNITQQYIKKAIHAMITVLNWNITNSNKNIENIEYIEYIEYIEIFQNLLTNPDITLSNLIEEFVPLITNVFNMTIFGGAIMS